MARRNNNINKAISNLGKKLFFQRLKIVNFGKQSIYFNLMLFVFILGKNVENWKFYVKTEKGDIVWFNFPGNGVSANLDVQSAKIGGVLKLFPQIIVWIVKLFRILPIYHVIMNYVTLSKLLNINIS